MYGWESKCVQASMLSLKLTNEEVKLVSIIVYETGRSLERRV